MDQIVALVRDALWLVLPAYFANAAPVIFGGGPPLDGGRTWKDGRPIFGKHKTVRGFISGVLLGTVVGAAQKRTLAGFLMGLGSMLGDAAGSFIKRRLDLRPGDQAPGLDQLGFILVALVIVYPLERPTTDVLLTAVLVTPFAHVVANAVAVLLGLKRWL